jgi:hypothetical protein
MSNETANRSHAGAVIQMFTDPDNNPPKLLASWGFVAATLAPVPGVDGYSMRLESPGSGLVGPDPTSFENIDSVILTSAVVGDGVIFARAILLPDPALPAPAVGDRAQLAFLAIALTDETGTGVDGDAVLQLEVRAVPTQD